MRTASSSPFLSVARRRSAALVLTLAAALTSAACGSKSKKAKTTPVAATQTPSATTQPPVQAQIQTPTTVTPPSLEPIYFEYDSDDITEDARVTLNKIADYLGKDEKATVTITGHTDDRGTTEYNLALGDRRAMAAHDYLVRMGVDPSRVKTVSYGEERPAIPGEGEDAWSKNRRGEFETSTR